MDVFLWTKEYYIPNSNPFSRHPYHHCFVAMKYECSSLSGEC